MLIYRIENDECQGPYTTGEIPVTHQHWFRPPHWWKDTKCPENGRYGMDNLLDLYLIFKPCASDGEIWISVYECPDEHAVVLYSIYGCSRQVVLISRRRLVPADFRYRSRTFPKDIWKMNVRSICGSPLDNSIFRDIFRNIPHWR